MAYLLLMTDSAQLSHHIKGGEAALLIYIYYSVHISDLRSFCILHTADPVLYLFVLLFLKLLLDLQRQVIENIVEGSVHGAARCPYMAAAAEI